MRKRVHTAQDRPANRRRKPAMPVPLPVDDPAATSARLFHQLNNQLGIILANAELLEAKAGDDLSRRRASQVVASVLDAMATAKEIRARLTS